MTREIEIDGKKIVFAELTFGNVRKMSKMGVDFGHLSQVDTLTLVHAYIRVSINVSEEVADALIQKYILAGGSLDEIVEAFGEALTESDFFQALAKTDETATDEARA